MCKSKKKEELEQNEEEKGEVEKRALREEGEMRCNKKKEKLYVTKTKKNNHRNSVRYKIEQSYTYIKYVSIESVKGVNI